MSSLSAKFDEPKQLHGTYIGPIVELQGKTALLERDPALPERWFHAQFDEEELVYGGKRLGLGRHATLPVDWKIDQPEAEASKTTEG